MTGIIPSWGILTGIRPEKLFRELVLRENSTEKAGDIMSKKYLVQPDRIKLLNEIYEIQKPFCKDSSQKNKVEIYIGIQGFMNSGPSARGQATPGPPRQ